MAACTSLYPLFYIFEFFWYFWYYFKCTSSPISEVSQKVLRGKVNNFPSILATLVALHSIPVSERLGGSHFQTSRASRLASLFYFYVNGRMDTYFFAVKYHSVWLGGVKSVRNYPSFVGESLWGATRLKELQQVETHVWDVGKEGDPSICKHARDWGFWAEVVWQNIFMLMIWDISRAKSIYQKPYHFNLRWRHEIYFSARKIKPTVL